MISPQTVSENDVLVGAALWLRARGVVPLWFSVATGQGINADLSKQSVRQALVAAGIPGDVVQFSGSGPDVIAISRTEWWQIECKGAGTGTQSTQRNNFDRALASAVCYFGNPLPSPASELDEMKAATPHLGLALPATPDYLRELKRRVLQPLRQALNLWVLLYQPQNKSIVAVPPSSDYPL